MEIRQLEYFRAIVDAGTISGAARVLHMTQPPLSYQMKMLEEELQVSLFLRGTKKITLTDAGKTLYEQAGNLLMLADLTKQEVVKSGQAATPAHRDHTIHCIDDVRISALLCKNILKFILMYMKDLHLQLKDQLENGMIDLTTPAHQLC